ncbi:MAG TPA: ABC transporter permease [Alphaproteobacteria bacterium]|nr:ABC transporter permease [Rhodospirillaceae bacterium]HRJ12714.1 ABC transporter permease [Alphaproteobacteria bacterium]
MNSIALKMLIGDTTKYVSLIIGITFAALIMTQQPSIFWGLMTRTYGFIDDIGYPDLWVVDPEARYIDDVKPMSDTMLQRVRSIEGVRWATPLFKGSTEVLLSDGSFENSTLVGIDSTTMIGAPPKLLSGQLTDLRMADAVIVNEEGAKERLARQMPDGNKIPLQVGDTLEINEKRAVVVGVAQTSRSFQSRPVLYTTYERAVNYVPQQRRLLTFVLAKVKDGENIDLVAKRISDQTGMKAVTSQQFKDMTFNHYMKRTGIPINFGVAVLLGFVIGAVVTGQTFYAFTHENLKQYAALKAMGARAGTLMRMIVLQAISVGVMGWCLGVGCAALFGYSMRKSILAFKMSPELFLFSGFVTLIIVSIAALISIVKVIRVEPALVFKG